jgi:hypothetical protein
MSSQSPVTFGLCVIIDYQEVSETTLKAASMTEAPETITTRRHEFP